MKKIVPSILVIALFAVLMVVQMSIHGQKLTANKLSKEVEKYAIYENQFSKLKLKTTRGSTFELSELEEPIIVLNFWASWCKPCVKEFESLNKLKSKFSGKLEIIGINNDDEEAIKKVRKAESEYNLNFESTLDTDGEIASLFNITRIPASIVYHKGKIIHFADEEFNFMNAKFIRMLNEKLKL